MTDAEADLKLLAQFRPDWDSTCETCESLPVVPATGLCGPCTYGEAATVAGAWWTALDEERYQRLLKTKG